jgi:o-succinylbenzoate---CoA ligase
VGESDLIDWNSSKTHWMMSPFFTATEKRLTRDAAKRLTWVKDHLWVASSGTTRTEGMKWIGISRTAFLASAQSVNAHLEVSKSDVWMNVLPPFHVSGISMFARAFVSKTKVIDLSKSQWSAEKFVVEVTKAKGSLSSLVPTQVFDLVSKKLKAPSSMRAIVVSGGAMDRELFLRARELGWPLLTAYGLTETCGQIATADLASLKAHAFPEMKLLAHAKVKLEEGRLLIQALSACDYVVTLGGNGSFSMEDPKHDGWLRTEDIVEIHGAYLEITGRTQERVKVLGELVSLNRVEEELRARVGENVCVLSVPHLRKGHALIAVFENPKSLRDCRDKIEIFQKECLPIWRLENWYAVEKFPQASLGKILKAKLKTSLNL